MDRAAVWPSPSRTMTVVSGPLQPPTDRGARLVTAPISNPAKVNWKEVLAVRNDVMLSNFEPFQDFYVLVERENGLPQLTVVNLASGAPQRPSNLGRRFARNAFTPSR